MSLVKTIAQKSIEQTPKNGHTKMEGLKVASSAADEKKVDPPQNISEPTPPIGERLKKLDELNRLNERRSLLADALDDVRSFVHTPTAPASIKFIDSTNKGFSVSNPLVIADMLKLAAERLESELEKVEALIKF